MSLHYLGDLIDVHTGGIDLRFPHHEDERAQSDSVTGHEVVGHWVHGEHLLLRRAVRWPSPPATWCCSATSPAAGSIRSRSGWPCSSTATGSG